MIAIANNAENPGASVAALIAVEASIGAKEGLLHDVLGCVGIAAEKACEIIGRVEVGHDVPLELP